MADIIARSRLDLQATRARAAGRGDAAGIALLLQCPRSAMFPHFAPGRDDTRWLLKALREAAHELEAQLWGLDEDDLRRRLSDDAWSLKEIAAHLRDCEQHFLRSLELIAFQDTPPIPAFDADALVLEHDYRDVDIYEVLERFEYLRYRAVSLLWSLDNDDWERSGLHPYLGPVSISRLAREQNEHDLEHLWQARRLRQALSNSTSSST